MLSVKRLFSLAVLGAGFLCLATPVRAQEEAMNMTVEQAKAWHNELSGDREALKEQHEEIKTSAQEAKGEEAALREQIQQAEQAGNLEEAKKLKAQWRQMHRANVADKKSDMEGLKQARQEMKSDIQAAKDAGYKPKRGRGKK